MIRHALTFMLCGALASPGALAAGNRIVSTAVAEPQPVDFEPDVDYLTVEQDPERFREQILGFLHDLESSLLSAMARPEVAERGTAALAQGGLGIPFPKLVYETIENATLEQLEATRDLVAEMPEVLVVPEALRSGLDDIAIAETISLRSASDCTENYSSFSTMKKLALSVEGLGAINDAIRVKLPSAEVGLEVVQAATADVQFVGKLPSLPFVIIVHVMKISIVILGGVQDSLSTYKDVVDLNLSGCCQDASPSELLAGRGCDNRDNNCAGGIDESGEDRFPPIIEIPSDVVGRCYPDAAAANEALSLGVAARDDCSTVTPAINFAVPGGSCRGTFTASATDAGGNTTTVGPYALTVDSTPPELLTPTFLECYRSVGEARTELQRTVIRDCTDVQTNISAVSSRCEAQLELEAVDECGGRSVFTTEVQVDDSPPRVDIRKLLLPSVDGTFCFDSEEDAIESVTAVTVLSDNCTSASELSRSTIVGGELCNMVITSAAVDACGRRGQDGIPARVDTEAPVVTCSVETDRLWPADGTMVDVGFSMTVADNCDSVDDLDVEVFVTSDEPTALARRTLGADPYPDTVIEHDGDGNVTSILLRAERSDFGPADGRVYRIRVVATDSCGIEEHADCWVQVPRQTNRSQAINSGQNFEADAVN